MQVPPATEVSPAPQFVQSVTASLPAGDDLPALQDEHVVAPEAAYLPAPQDIQGSRPAALLYLPPSHCLHTWNFLCPKLAAPAILVEGAVIQPGSGPSVPLFLL